LEKVEKHNRQLKLQHKVKVIKKGVRKNKTAIKKEDSDAVYRKKNVMPSVVFTNHMRTSSLPQLNRANSINRFSGDKRVASPVLIESSRKNSVSKFDSSFSKSNTAQRKFKLDIFKPPKRNNNHSHFLKNKRGAKKTNKKYRGTKNLHDQYYGAADNNFKKISLFDEIEPSHLEGIDHKTRIQMTGKPRYAWEFERQEEPILAREGATFTCINEFGEGLLVGGLSQEMIQEYHM
jgi:hypothetical protein